MVARNYIETQPLFWSTNVFSFYNNSSNSNDILKAYVKTRTWGLLQRCVGPTAQSQEIYHLQLTFF